MKSVGGRLTWEKQSGGNLQNWIKIKLEKHCFYIDGCRIVNNQHLQHVETVCGEQDDIEISGLVLWCLWL